MAFTDALFEVARPLWEAQLAHPFVRGIADGSLPEELFQRWVLQDYRYLAEGAGEDKRRRLTELFLLSGRWEWQFWEMCWRGESWPV